MGLILDVLYIQIQRFHWDQDWPFAYQFFFSIVEFFIVFYAMDFGYLDFMFPDGRIPFSTASLALHLGVHAVLHRAAWLRADLSGALAVQGRRARPHEHPIGSCVIDAGRRGWRPAVAGPVPVAACFLLRQSGRLLPNPSRAIVDPKEEAACRSMARRPSRALAKRAIRANPARASQRFKWRPRSPQSATQVSIPKDIDGIIAYGSMAVVAEDFITSFGIPDLKFSAVTPLGGASAVASIQCAAAAVAAGICNHVLIPIGRNGSSGAGGRIGSRVREMPQFRLIGEFEMPLGAIAPAQLYAPMARRHMELYGTTSRQLAEIAVSTRHNAILNGNAMMTKPLTVEDHQASRMISDPLRLFDCSPRERRRVCVHRVVSGARARLRQARDLRSSALPRAIPIRPRPSRSART